MTSPSETAFLQALLGEMAASRSNRFSDNYDFHQLGPEPASKEAPVWLKGIRDVFGTIGHYINYYVAPKKYFEKDALRFSDIQFLPALVGNQKSKDLVIKLCAYRALGYRKIKLPRNTDAYWADMKRVDDLQVDGAEPVKIKFMDATLKLHDCNPIGFDLKVYGTGPGVTCTMVQKQYEYIDPSKGVRCKAEPGDIVIDAGGCWGDTTLYFAHEAGPEGRVVVFEFIPSNLEILDLNLRTNPQLADRITLVRQPIWSRSGLRLYYVDWGPGSRVTDDEDVYKYDGICETISIDDMVEQQKLPRVDFIKMDIEGAELAALKGARNTIRTHRPKLAISLYHSLGDFTTIPRYLFEIGVPYDFFVDHHTIYQNETVLYAVPADRPTPV